jgi:predicted nucleic-acid-binding protein
MIGIDTNVLVRYLLQDDPVQGRKAARFIEKCTADEPGVISQIVLCELVWVLVRGYRYPRAQVALALEKILHTPQFAIEAHDEAWSAFLDYRAGDDFADALIGRVNRRAGCAHTVTFDRQASRRADFVLL